MRRASRAKCNKKLLYNIKKKIEKNFDYEDIVWLKFNQIGVSHGLIRLNSNTKQPNTLFFSFFALNVNLYFP